MSDVDELLERMAGLDKFAKPEEPAAIYTDHKSFQAALLDDETITEGYFPADHIRQEEFEEMYRKHLAGELPRCRPPRPTTAGTLG
jgi:hypothetical protein